MTFFKSQSLDKIFLTTIFCIVISLVVVHISQKEKRSENGKSTAYNTCIAAGQKIDVQCFSREIDEVLVTQGADAAMERLANVSRFDDQFASSCHGFAHRIGQETYKVFAQGKDIAISPKITYCTYGFYHGFMEAAAQLNGDYKKIAGFCTLIDEKLRGTGLDSSAECFHGIGHGAVEEHDAQEKKDAAFLAHEALQLCEKATQAADRRVSCASGVFNGIANAYTAGQYGLSADSKSPAQLCKDQPEYAKGTCYAFMARVYLALTKGNFSEALTLAKETAELDFMDSIVSNAAVLYAGRYLKEDLDPIILSCRSLNRIWQDACIKGAVQGLVQSSPPEQEFQNGIRLCHMASLSGEEKETCVRELFMELKKIYRRERLRVLCEASKPFDGEYDTCQYI